MSKDSDFRVRLVNECHDAYMLLQDGYQYFECPPYGSQYNDADSRDELTEALHGIQTVPDNFADLVEDSHQTVS